MTKSQTVDKTKLITWFCLIFHENSLFLKNYKKISLI